MTLNEISRGLVLVSRELISGHAYAIVWKVRRSWHSAIIMDYHDADAAELLYNTIKRNEDSHVIRIHFTRKDREPNWLTDKGMAATIKAEYLLNQ